MAAVTSSVTQFASQGAWQEIQRQMAQRTADQAEQTARALKAKADGAAQDAAQAQEKARDLDTRYGQARSYADLARSNLTQFDQMSALSDSLAKGIAALDQAVTSTPVPTVNSEGQTVGQVISEVA